MKKPLVLTAAMALLASPAFAQAVPETTQVRPQDCRPVLPVVDRAAAVLPQDVVAEPAAPAVAAGRRFLGLPLLLPALLAAGGIGALATDDNGGGNNPPPVSPA